jgi:catechol 2,3-dioxygenase-like lactoylglutathione lyase family enzyme
MLSKLFVPGSKRRGCNLAITAAILKENNDYTHRTASSPLASLKINHAAIRVPDFDMAVAWYADKLDFRLKKSVPVAGLTFGFLYPAGDDSFHFELMAGPGAAERPPYKDLHDSYNMPGWHHPGFSVDSVDDVIAELKRRNGASRRLFRRSLAIGELVNDKLPKTPSRLIPPQFITRIVTSALCGLAIGFSGNGTIIGLAAGIIGAAAGTFGEAKVRSF